MSLTQGVQFMYLLNLINRYYINVSFNKNIPADLFFFDRSLHFRVLKFTLPDGSSDQVVESVQSQYCLRLSLMSFLLRL